MKRRRTVLRAVSRLAMLAAAAGLAFFAYRTYLGDKTESEGVGELPKFVAQVRDITASVQATGVLQPVRIVEVKSKASGEIIEMPVELGDSVHAGDLIVQVHTEILQQELTQAQADLEAAEVRLKIATRQYERAQGLFDEGVISLNDLESSEENFTTAEAQRLRTEAALKLARERLEDATVRAPLSGTIIEKTVEVGQIIASTMSNVSGGTTLVRMADLSQLEIRTLVDEIDIGLVRPGLRVESRVEAFPVMKFEGRVIKIEPSAVVEQSVTTFPVLSRIDNSAGHLLPGMNADVAIIVQSRTNVLAVPSEVVRTPEDAQEILELLGFDAAFAEGGRRRHERSEAPASGRAEAATVEPAVVFTLNLDGRIEPRPITLVSVAGSTPKCSKGSKRVTRSSTCRARRSSVARSPCGNDTLRARPSRV